MRSSLGTAWGRSAIAIISISFLAMVVVGFADEPSGPATVAQLAASVNSGITAYARLSDGRVLSWGANESGQLGDGSSDNRALPAAVVCGEAADNPTFCSDDGKLRDVAALAAGGGFVVALLSDGSVLNWGANTAGQLGVNDTNGRKAPVEVKACKDAVGEFVLVITGESCEGNGGTVTPLTGARAITAGGFTSYAILHNDTPDQSDDFVVAWGTNLSGAAGVGPSGGNGVRHPYPVACGVAAAAFCSNGRLTGVAAIASGGATDLIEPTNNTLHALALLTDGRVLAWGENVAGKLGTGNQQGSAVPVQVRAVGGAVGSALSGVTAIAANQNSSYAISNGNVLAWGGNSSGQLGDGTLANRFSPIVVRACKNGNTFLGVTAAANCTALGGVLTDLTEVEALSTGGVTNLALMKDGGVLAWGANQATQLGDGTATAAKRTPVSVLCGAAGSPGTEFCDDANRLRGVVEVASGIGDSYARLSNGQVLAWGGNASGQLGDGSVFNIRTTPIQPPGLDGPASAVAAGGGFSLVLHVSQMLSSWGFVTSGQLGVGSTIPSISPVRVRDVGGAAGSAFTGATTVVAGASTSYTIKDARPFAWGAGGSGQIGDGAGGNRLAPVAVHCGALAADPVFCPGGVLTGVTAISAASGSLHVIALLSDGRVISWGANTIFGRLGDGTTVGIRTSPVEVVCGEMAGTPFCSPNGKLQGAKAVSTGTINSYAILTDGTALAWGGGTTGALGNGALAHVSSPVRVGCGEMAGISAFCGEDGKLKGVTAIAGGANYAVALLSDSSLVSWGLNDAGQLGNGTTTDAILPVRVKGPDGAGDLVGVTAIDAGISTTYALQSGNVLAWGVGGSGQLGHGRVTSSPLPIRVKSCRAPDGTFTGESKEFCIAPNVFEDLDSVTAVSGGGNYALAVRSDGNVLAWGGNSTNQLAIPLDSARPLPGFVKLDLTAPAVTINSPTPGALARGAIEIAATATDLSTVTWFACSAEGVALGTSSEGSFSAQLNTLTIPDGPRAIACEAADPSGNIGSATRNITVDNTPPTAAISLSRSTLWPPNGKLAPVTIVVTVQDNIALSSGALIRSFTIVSNEPDDSLGTMGDVNGMDGHSGPVDVTAQSVAYSSDFKSATVSATVQLRAERLAILHDGRAYSISVEVADAAGNVAAAPGAAVTVPLNQAP